MYIKEIELKNYRNYDHLKIGFNEKANLVLGSNASGKTNLLESIYLASLGRSFRSNKDAELVKFGRAAAKIRVEAEKNSCGTTVEIIIKRDSKKSVKKDGRHIKSVSELLDNILIVVFSPEDLKLIKDEPEKRRRFVDRELCQILPSYCDNLSNYKKALLQRNACLRDEDAEMSVIDLWDMQLVRYGTKVTEEREKFIKKLNGYSGPVHANITGGREKLLIKYEPSVGAAEDREGYFYSELRRAFPRDRKEGNTSIGPHRDDISFYVNGVNMRSYGSQGQQRTCALSLKLAELDLINKETGENAILLLDDVMSELDSKRQEFLMRALKHNQIFITGTDKDEKIFRTFPEAKVFYIEGGKVIREI